MLESTSSLKRSDRMRMQQVAILPHIFAPELRKFGSDSASKVSDRKLETVQMRCTQLS